MTERRYSDRELDALRAQHAEAKRKADALGRQLKVAPDGTDIDRLYDAYKKAADAASRLHYPIFRELQLRANESRIEPALPDSGHYPDLMGEPEGLRGASDPVPRRAPDGYRHFVYDDGRVHLFQRVVGGHVVSGLTVKAKKARGGWQSGTIDKVNTAPEYRRKGYAGDLLRYARSVMREVKHSKQLTTEGKAWKRAVKNPDEDLRRVEREAGRGGVQEQARLLVEQMRAGAIDPPERVRMAAVLGDPAARLADPQWLVWLAYLGQREQIERVQEPHNVHFLFEQIADALRPWMRPWGPPIVRQVWDLSNARLEDVLQTTHPPDNRWRLATDRSLTAMSRDQYSEALDQNALAIAWAHGEEQPSTWTGHMFDEQRRQQADLIAALLNRPLPRTTIHPNPGGDDAHLRDLERRARETGAPQDLAALLVAMVRAGTIDPQHVAWAAALGYEPAELASPQSHAFCRQARLDGWSMARRVDLVVSEIAASSESDGQPSRHPVLVGARRWSADRNPCGRVRFCRLEAENSEAAWDAGAWEEAFRCCRRMAAWAHRPTHATRSERMDAEARLQARDLIGALLDPRYLPPAAKPKRRR